MQFPEDYFQDEYRCDFLVPEMMKRAWAAQIEILEVIIDICNRHHLQYFAEYGTLLGAVRHHGFVPWDDDIDISLKRADYNKLIQILPQELPEGLALIGMYGTAKHLQDAAPAGQSAVSTVPARWKFQDFLKRFHGFPYRLVNVELFPLDYIPRDKDLADIQKLIIHNITVLLRDWDTYDKEELEKRIQNVEELCDIKVARNENIKNTLWRLSDSVSSMYQEDEADELAYYPAWIAHEPNHFKKEWYDEVIYLPFEVMEIAVPKHYDEILTHEYGDYHRVVKSNAWHDYPFYAGQEKRLKKDLEKHGYFGSIEEFCKNSDQFHIIG